MRSPYAQATRAYVSHPPRYTCKQLGVCTHTHLPTYNLSTLGHVLPFPAPLAAQIQLQGHSAPSCRPAAGVWGVVICTAGCGWSQGSHLLLVLLILQVLELEGNTVTSNRGKEAPQPQKCLVGFKVLHNSYSGFLASTFFLPCYDLSLVWRPWYPRFASSDFGWVHREAAQMFPGI